MNPDQELYGEERLIVRTAALAHENTRGLCDRLGEDVHAFAAGADQSDDITMLALRYCGSDKNAG
jgi:sigma-B regulation protein RsbU (phosphoserine phosphatase)